MAGDGVVTFAIPGSPIPKGRPRKGPNGWYTPKRTKDYETLVAQCAMVAGLRMDPEATCSVEIELHLSRRRFDVDNAAKSILDGLQRMAGGWNDRQVTSLIVREVSVLDASEERAVVTILERGSK